MKRTRKSKLSDEELADRAEGALEYETSIELQPPWSIMDPHPRRGNDMLGWKKGQGLPQKGSWGNLGVNRKFGPEHTSKQFPDGAQHHGRFTDDKLEDTNAKKVDKYKEALEKGGHAAIDAHTRTGWLPSSDVTPSQPIDQQPYPYVPGPVSVPTTGETPFQWAAGGWDEEGGRHGDGKWFPNAAFDLEAKEGRLYADQKIAAKRAANKKTDSVDKAYLRTPFTAASMLAWFCIRVVIYGLHHIQFAAELCWSDDDIYRIPFVKQLMPLALYQAHSRYIHFEDNNKEEELKYPQGKTSPEVDREWKTRRIRDLYMSTFQRLHNCFRDLIIDEKVCDTHSSKVRRNPLQHHPSLLTILYPTGAQQDPL